MNEWPPTTPPLPKPKDEKEPSPEENQEVLGVSEIMEKIERGERPSLEEEKILKENIEDAILRRGSEKTAPEEMTLEEEEKREEEKEILAAYLKGVEMEWFMEGDITRMAIDFDLETIKFNKLENREKKEKEVNSKKEEFKNDLADREIMVEDFEEMEEAKKKMEKELTEQVLDHEDILAQIKNEELNFDELGKAKLKEMIYNLRENDQNLLDLHKFEYYFEDVNKLVEEYHTEKVYIIKMLEEALEAYDQIIILLEKKEEELKPEEQEILEKMFKWIKENKGRLTILAILTMLGALGLIYGPGLLAGMAGEKVAETIAEEGIKTIAEKAGAKKLGLLGIMGGAGLLGAVLYKLSQIKEEDVDDIMSKICGVSIAHRKTTTEKS